MSDFPKLRVKRTWTAEVETITLENARYSLFSGTRVVVTVEGQIVSSYDELVKLVSQDEYKGKKFLEVVIDPLWPAGG